ncbi:MAG: monovalent cation/H(+) antiporter subunit G [Deltaproteobacteria bacterium]|nr:monovalent cation/H(+) antiporter subunit G [Deltaproteobacteria bacterium]
MTWLAAALMVIGGVFLLISSIGLLRLPDFYTRAHAVGKSETLGSMLVLGGLALNQGADLTSVKILLILVVIFITNPTATHALTRSAYRSGVAIWKNSQAADK